MSRSSLPSRASGPGWQLRRSTCSSSRSRTSCCRWCSPAGPPEPVRGRSAGRWRSGSCSTPLPSSDTASSSRGWAGVGHPASGCWASGWCSTLAAASRSAAVLRNVLRLVDEFFPLAPVLPGVLLIFFSKRNQRLGDMAAGTIVVRDRPTELEPGIGAVRSPRHRWWKLGPPELTEDEFRLLDRFLARISGPGPGRAGPVGGGAGAPVRAPDSRQRPDLQGYLVEVFTQERARGRSRFGTRARPGNPGRITVTAERFVERKRQGWEAFRARPRESSAPACARFRRRDSRVCGPLPGGRRRPRPRPDLRSGPAVVEYLERLPPTGHNALYRFDVGTGPVGRELFAEFPARWCARGATCWRPFCAS